MKYQDFIDSIRQSVSDCLPDGLKTEIRPVTKNNGLIYDGLYILDPVLNVSPTIYLNPYYHRFLSGISLEEIRDDILETYHAKLPLQDFDTSIFTDFSKARHRLLFRLVHRDRNEALLSEIPHLSFLDLAIIFVCDVSEYLNEYATILIHNEHLYFWNITQEELSHYAMENTPKRLPPLFLPLLSVFPEEIRAEFTDSDLPEVYILTNEHRVHGASCILYPGLLSKISDQLEDDLILLPSSIHEFLIIPGRAGMRADGSAIDFSAIIHEVNETHLEDSEILGDHPYIYHRANGKIER